MKCIKILTDKYFGLDEIPFSDPRIRYGARGLVFNSDGNIAILNKQKKNEYKLVGGGIDKNELPDDAFSREVLEEAGASIKDIKLLGTIEEHKSQDNFKQISYVYVAKADKITLPHFTQKEIDEGSRIIWISVDEAMRLIKESENNLKASKYENVYHSKFIVRRDYEILKYYQNSIKF